MEATTSANAQRPNHSVRSSRPIRITDGDEHEFIEAVAEYKRRSGRLFPTCSELLEVIQSLGYAKRIWKPVESWPEAFDPPSIVSVDEPIR